MTNLTPTEAVYEALEVSMCIADAQELPPSTTLEDLGADSLDMHSFSMEMHEHLPKGWVAVDKSFRFEKTNTIEQLIKYYNNG